MSSKKGRFIEIIFLQFLIIILIYYSNSPQISRNKIGDPINDFLLAPSSEKYKAFCGDYNILFKEFIRNQNEFFVKKRVKTIVWRCGQGSGGLGDRFHGLITTFLMSVLLQKSFLIDCEFPTNLSPYLGFWETNDLSWDFSNLRISRNYSSHEINIIDAYYTNVKYFQETNLTEKLDTDMFIIKTNLPMVSYLIDNSNFNDIIKRYQFDLINKQFLFGCLFNFVLYPKGLLYRRLRKFISDEFLENEIIGIQIRTGGDSKKWKDERRVPLNSTHFFWDCAKKIEATRSNLDKKIKIFVSSDNEYVLKESIEIFGPEKILTIPGNIVHIDRSPREEGENGMLKTLMDFFLLSSSKYLIISRSNFGEIAALRSFKGAYLYDSGCEKIRFDLTLGGY